ncbi:tRNA N6-adenosine threonylcarbamoyltransferase-like [Schistocerca gregaria]|uniref:tRNA N6-adenosine threonylcarbamoyltransferase-like n=1 Tax=Schistocerca gregaria TaxID=7010 RepID=UPI00211E9EAD|nr:tRNA N6-adenosine threonylcarbamoyltransferase-like [Schistocerca gregaria]
MEGKFFSAHDKKTSSQLALRQAGLPISHSRAPRQQRLAPILASSSHRRRPLSRTLFRKAPSSTPPMFLVPSVGRRRGALAACKRPYWSSRRLILGIESSCDDTAAAVVSSDREVLAKSVAKQDDIHLPWRGVVPRLAAEAHRSAIDRVVDEVMAESGVSYSDLEAVAVTRGPGLAFCLEVGVSKAKSLATDRGLPLLGINHMEGHALAIRLVSNVDFPYLALLISGGHTQILAVRGAGDYSLLGETLDVAIGDAFDKVARMLGLRAMNGGQELEETAELGNPDRFSFTLPMQKTKNCDFSFSGLQTAVLEKLNELGGLSHIDRPSVTDLAASFQQVAIDHLKQRLRHAFHWASKNEPSIRQLVLSGGVACNRRICRELGLFARDFGIDLASPPPELCRDNGVMIAWAGHENLASGKPFDNPIGLRYLPKWPLDSSGIDYFPGTHFSHRLAREEKKKQTISTHETRIAQHPPNPLIFYKASKAAFKLQQWDAAKNFALRGLAHFPDNAYLHSILRRIDQAELSLRSRYP